MADTQAAIIIGKDWVNVTTETGIPAGTELLLQNLGLPQDVIELATSPTVPDDDFKGVYLRQISPMLRVTAGESDVWARLYRYDRENIGLRAARLQVQVVT